MRLEAVGIDGMRNGSIKAEKQQAAVADFNNKKCSSPRDNLPRYTIHWRTCNNYSTGKLS